MSNLNARMSLGGLAALTAALVGNGKLQYPYYNVGEDPMPPRPTAAQTARWRDQRGYPQTGTGKRQGARIARQVARAMGDPFAASNKCIERIKSRSA